MSGTTPSPRATPRRWRRSSRCRPNLDHPLSGSILLTDVYETQLNALTYLQERYFSSDAQVYSAGQLIGSSTPANQYIDQGYLQMSQAQSDATAAALTHLGYTVTQKNAGVLVYGIPPGTPASHVLKVSEVLTAVNGTATPTPCALVNALHGLVAGHLGDAHGRGVVDQRVRGVRGRPHRAAQDHPRHAAQGPRRHRMRAGHQGHRVPGHRDGAADGVELPGQGIGAHGRHRWARPPGSP